MTEDQRRIFEQVYSELGQIRQRPAMWVQPVTPEALDRYLWTLSHGVYIGSGLLPVYDLGRTRYAVSARRGWDGRVCGVYAEMREKGYPEQEIFEEILIIEAESWKLAEEECSKGMAEITAAHVQALKEKSGSGIGDCKQALIETSGDEQAALEWLRSLERWRLGKDEDNAK